MTSQQKHREKDANTRTCKNVKSTLEFVTPPPPPPPHTQQMSYLKRLCHPFIPSRKIAIADKIRKGNYFVSPVDN